MTDQTDSKKDKSDQDDEPGVDEEIEFVRAKYEYRQGNTEPLVNIICTMFDRCTDEPILREE